MKFGKIAHVSSVHPPGDTRIAIKECATLSKAGFDVVFVCPHPTDTVMAGVKIRGVRARKGRIARVLMTVVDVFRVAHSEKPDAYHLHDPELLPVALLLRLVGAKVVYDSHEDFPKAIRSKYWIPAPVRLIASSVAGTFEWAAARAMSGVVAATPPIARRFPSSRTVVVQNFSIVDELRLAQPTSYPAREPVFAYVGGIAAIRGAVEMVSAIGLLPEDLGATLVLAGPQSHNELMTGLRAIPGWSRVQHFGWRSRDQVADLLGTARAGVLLMHPVQNYVEAYPVKIFEYMAASLPMILSNFKLWKDILGDVGCAIFVNPLDAGAVAAAMQWILDNPEEAERMGARGRVAVQERFNWKTEGEKLVNFYRKLLFEPGAHPVIAI